MSTESNPPPYVICIHDEANPASLQKRKLYRVVPSKAEDPAGYVRIIDEEGEDYLYPQDWFVPAVLPAEILAAVASS